MKNRDRYLYFGIGTCVGIIILIVTIYGKIYSINEREASDFKKGYTRSTRFLPGQDCNAISPISAPGALFVKDYELQPDNTFTRVTIVIDPQSNDFFRFDEIIWKDPQSTRELLICRRQLAANELIVRLNKKTDSIKDFQKIISDLNMSIIGPGRMAGLYRIKLFNPEPETLTQFIEKLLQHSTIVDAAVPSYNIKIQGTSIRH